MLLSLQKYEPPMYRSFEIRKQYLTVQNPNKKEVVPFIS